MNHTLFMDCSKNLIMTYLESNNLVNYKLTFAYQIIVLDCVFSNGSYAATFYINLDNKLYFKIEYLNSNNTFKLDVFNHIITINKTLDQIMED